MLRYVPEELRTEDLCVAAVKHDGRALMKGQGDTDEKNLYYSTVFD
jgi:hypothetical protein